MDWIKKPIAVARISSLVYLLVVPAVSKTENREVAQRRDVHHGSIVINSWLEKIPWEGEFTIRSDLWSKPLFLSYTINHRTGKWTEALMERRTLALILLVSLMSWFVIPSEENRYPTIDQEVLHAWFRYTLAQRIVSLTENPTMVNR